MVTTRRTRSSTQSQTARSRSNAQSKPNTTQTQSTSRVNKKQKKKSTTPRTAHTADVHAAEPRPKAAAARAKPAKAHSNATALENTSAQAADVRHFTITSPLIKSPVVCEEYSPSRTSTSAQNQAQSQSQGKGKGKDKDNDTTIFTHGAGGTLSAPAVVHFCTGYSSACTRPLLAFQGSSNLGARVKGFLACHEHVGARDVVFAGRSMGARAAVVAAAEVCGAAGQEGGGGGGGGGKARLVLVSYPLQGPKDVRDRVLLDLPAGVEVLFVVGDRDKMCPLGMLEDVRARMKARSRVVVVRGADHGMNVRPASRTQAVGEETGRVAARWVDGEMESEGEVVYIGEVD